MKNFLLLAIVLIVILSACATTTVQIRERVSINLEKRIKIARYAEGLLDVKDLKSINGDFRNDCSGFVIGVYNSSGFNVKLDPYPNVRVISQLLYLNLRRSGLVFRDRLPDITDVVFFKGTTNKSRGGISHVGLVEDVMDDGTILILHYSSKGVSRLRMNLNNPHSYKNENGLVINDFLRKKSQVPGNNNLLAGELFYCFGDLFRYTNI